MAARGHPPNLVPSGQAAAITQLKRQRPPRTSPTRGFDHEDLQRPVSTLRLRPAPFCWSADSPLRHALARLVLHMPATPAGIPLTQRTIEDLHVTAAAVDPPASCILVPLGRWSCNGRLQRTVFRSAARKLTGLYPRSLPPTLRPLRGPGATRSRLLALIVASSTQRE